MILLVELLFLSMEDSLLKIVLVGLAALLTVATKLVNDWMLAEKELRQVIAELSDLRRHFGENVKIIKAMDINRGIPSAMHFEKMKTPEDSIVFSPETFRRIKSEHAELIHEIRLIVRNGNIELSEVIAYSKSDKCSPLTLTEYLTHISGRTEGVSKNIDAWLIQLRKKPKPDTDKEVGRTRWVISRIGGWLLKLFSKKRIGYRSPVNDKPKHIIFDRPFPVNAADSGTEHADSGTTIIDLPNE